MNATAKLEAMLNAVSSRSLSALGICHLDRQRIYRSASKSHFNSYELISVARRMFPELIDQRTHNTWKRSAAEQWIKAGVCRITQESQFSKCILEVVTE